MGERRYLGQLLRTFSGVSPARPPPRSKLQTMSEWAHVREDTSWEYKYLRMKKSCQTRRRHNDEDVNLERNEELRADAGLMCFKTKDKSLQQDVCVYTSCLCTLLHPWTPWRFFCCCERTCLTCRRSSCVLHEVQRKLWTPFSGDHVWKTPPDPNNVKQNAKPQKTLARINLWIFNPNVQRGKTKTKASASPAGSGGTAHTLLETHRGTTYSLLSFCT